MDIRDSEQYGQFRGNVRAWIAEEVPAHLKGQRQGVIGARDADTTRWKPLEEAFARRGWGENSYPKEYGGSGFDLIQVMILQEEMIRAGIPYRNEPAVHNIVPILLRFGSEEQRERFIRPTLRREIIWAQGYSEPGAGSDLANLQLRAERTIGGYLLSGQKIWSSQAHHADWMFVLARTEPEARPKHAGISFLLVDRRTPGITVRPIRLLEGTQHFNEVFYDKVFVPETMIVGGLNQGWKVATTLLGIERFNHSHANPYLTETRIADLKWLARTGPDGLGGMLWDDPALRRRVAALEMDNDCVRFTRYRVLTALEIGKPPGPEQFIFKVFGTELTARIADAQMEVLGGMGMTMEEQPFGTAQHDLVHGLFYARGFLIGAGTSEVQRNIIAKRVLALPD
ncbi:MAG: acyl-CoA dehydrogenase family protein [Candidatus Lambdaproteobacteria bacterium]|nr:acyl-CoA dehydrogenase family protein [Candidatus Lambdaproteobacteria bacterium]